MVDEHNPELPDDFEGRADAGREPQLFAARRGTRRVSLAALVERVVDQFNDEHGADSPALRAATTRGQQYRLILDSVDYVLAVESVMLPDDDKADLVRRVHSELFGFGPLDDLLADETITTISLDGGERVSVRYGHGELTHLGLVFNDRAHMRQIVGRLLLQAGTELRDDQPIIETGLRVGERPVALNLVGPPIAHALTVDMRLHPPEPPTLADLASAGFMTDEVAELLHQLAASEHGIVVVGDVECGKTTLLNALALALPVGETLVSVERAGELRLPEEATQLTTRWPLGDDAGVTFGEQIEAALAREASCLLLDEVRADAPLTIAPLLDAPAAPRQLWAFRGVPDAKRLQSALGMLARRAGMMMGETFVHTLYERLPFIVTVARIRERLQVFSVAEWQPTLASDYPDYVMLMQYQNGQARPTGARPVRHLSLSDGFWDAYVDPSA